MKYTARKPRRCWRGNKKEIKYECVDCCRLEEHWPAFVR